MNVKIVDSKRMDNLTKVAEAADARERAESAFRAAVRAAHEDGLSLRRIAEAARVSHEAVRLICAAPTPKGTPHAR